MSGALSSEPTAWLFGSRVWGDTQTSANNLFIRGFLAEDKTYLDGLRIRPDGYLGYFAENLLPCSVSRCLEPLTPLPFETGTKHLCFVPSWQDNPLAKSCGDNCSP